MTRHGPDPAADLSTFESTYRSHKDAVYRHACSLLCGVVTRDGQPLPRAQVAAGQISLKRFDAREAVADEEGRFRMTDAPAGAYVVRVRDPRTGMLMFHGLRSDGSDTQHAVTWPGNVVEVPASETPPPPGAELTLVLLSFRKLPLALLVPEAYRVVATVDAREDGSYLITGVTPGLYEVRLESPGQPPRKARVTVSGPLTRIKLP